MILTRKARHDTIERLIPLIEQAMRTTPALILEAIEHGRVGLRNMTDQDLIITASIWAVPHTENE